MRDRVFLGAGVLALLLAAALNLRGAAFALQDFNEWAYQGWVIGQILRGEEIGFGIKPWPVPNAAAQFLLGVLNLPFGARAAGVVYLTAYLAGMGWLAVAVARARGGFNAATFLLAVCVGVLNSPYWDGYANSQLGTALYLIHVLRERRGGASVAWDVLMGVALFFCHAVLLGVFALHMALRGRVWAVAPAFGLLGWYLLRDANYGEAIPAFGTSIGEFIAYKVYSAAKLGPYQNFVIGAVGDAERAPFLYAFGVLANLVFVLVAVVPLGFALLGRIRAGDRSAPMLTAGACLIGYLVLPSAMFGVVNVGERLLVVGLLVILALCPDIRMRRPLGAMVALLLPAMGLYLHLLLPAMPPGGSIGHLAAHEDGGRMKLLFWHRAFYFQGQIAAAEKGEAVALRFTTSVLRPVAR
jgi:hypothetical protein